MTRPRRGARVEMTRRGDNAIPRAELQQQARPPLELAGHAQSTRPFHRVLVDWREHSGDSRKLGCRWRLTRKRSPGGCGSLGVCYPQHMPFRLRATARIRLAGFAEVLAIAWLAACGDSDSDDAGCLSAGGVYQRGKAPYPGANRGLVCCAGLTTYHRLWSNSDGSCVEPIIANFSCLTGRCGDGRCEDAEQGPCGCEADCAEAAP
jgi:hypothetical protein